MTVITRLPGNCIDDRTGNMLVNKCRTLIIIQYEMCSTLFITVMISHWQDDSLIFNSEALPGLLKFRAKCK